MNKLFYIANARIPTEKAHGVQIVKMCEAFAHRGFDVRLVVTNRKTSLKQDVYEYYGVSRNFKIIRLWCLDSVRFGKWGFRIETLFFTLRAIPFFIFKKGVFYTRDEFVAFFLKILKKNVIWEVHMGQNNILVKFLLLSKTKIVTITNGLRDYYLRLGAQDDKVLSAPDGVDLVNFQKIKLNKKEIRRKINLPIDKKIIGYVGKLDTMGKDKGINSLKIAYGLVKESLPDTFLEIVSDVPFKQVPLYMKAADVLVMNYPARGHYLKFMSPLKLFEYMASGIPIVSSDLLSVREILSEKNALLVKPDDPKELAKGIEMILKDYKLGEMLAYQALNDIKKYTWDKRAEVICKFIK